MGNDQTKPVTPQVITKPNDGNKKYNDSFGSYNDPENPRPGYYKLKSKRQVYYRGKWMPEVDFDTFVKLGKGYAEDKNGKYYRGKIVKQ